MDATAKPEAPSTPTSPTTDAELGVLGAQAARAERRHRRAMTHTPAEPPLDRTPEIRARAIELAQDAAAAGIIATTDVLATAGTYAAFIRGDTDGREG